MSFITALFALGIALASVGVMVAFGSSVAMIAAYDEEEASRSVRLLKMSAIAVLVGAFIIGLTAQGVSA